MAANIKYSHGLAYKDLYNTCSFARLSQNKYCLNQFLKKNLPKLPSVKVWQCWIEVVTAHHLLPVDSPQMQ